VVVLLNTPSSHTLAPQSPSTYQTNKLSLTQKNTKPSKQLMFMASRMKKDAARVVHVGSGTVFSNWPPRSAALHYVHSAAFSPNGGFMAVGNAQGRCLLYRLHHYGAA
jgi:hypothetical protein